MDDTLSASHCSGSATCSNEQKHRPEATGSRLGCPAAKALTASGGGGSGGGMHHGGTAAAHPLQRLVEILAERQKRRVAHVVAVDARQPLCNVSDQLLHVHHSWLSTEELCRTM